MDERVGTIAVGDFVELALFSPDDIAYNGILATIDERGVVVSPSAKQIAASPGVTAKNVVFFPWHNIAVLAVTSEA